jgi:hypothetical protein
MHAAHILRAFTFRPMASGRDVNEAAMGPGYHPERTWNKMILTGPWIQFRAHLE